MLRVTDLSGKFLPALQNLYESAFPKYERRDFTDLLELLPNKAMHIYVAVLDDVFAGFCIFWHLDDFVFLEHLAVVEELRGRQIGQQLIKWLSAQTNQQIILEVEMPTNEDSRRRITFYKRLGFILHQEVKYEQPPYVKEGSPVPMLLFSRYQPESKFILGSYIKEIEAQVYKVNYK
ncbi:GNAT family N-acetyltransferase [Pontibacter arcticus]|uniref:GNAT family N-acetyltransferase n=1 Tax=Pontibacter arcticus TaxID=2080288 RepID=A0A364REW0_9BACT|nr:GNAT family N-acetyltransferase [Pontibacter arcticus]RAU82706.1 GNAT family N-acetyltransferase [Pontibacter arcticus]